MDKLTLPRFSGMVRQHLRPLLNVASYDAYRITQDAIGLGVYEDDITPTIRKAIEGLEAEVRALGFTVHSNINGDGFWFKSIKE